jgi:hypothetical protein
MPSNLDRLNELLKDPALKLPAFRQTVHAGLSNLSWLQSKLPKNPAAGAELLALLKMPQKELCSERECEDQSA